MAATHLIAAKFPARLVSEANEREHWRVRKKRAKAHRAEAKRALGTDIKGPPPPYLITITRIGPKTLDTDNLAGSAKHVRDGVADWLGIDDGDPRLTWKYAQRSAGPGVYACEITIESECPA